MGGTRRRRVDPTGEWEQLARDEAHLYELVRHTVQHEVAHHFGISDERLRALGAY